MSFARTLTAMLVSQTLGAKAAAALDQELMSTGAFSIDQLMELAGLSVSQAGRSPHHSRRRKLTQSLTKLQFIKSIRRIRAGEFS